jgi:predicted TIM-barrel fold metal-dependent hydrolase
MKGSSIFYDVHVHPYEVLFDQYNYSRNLVVSGVLSIEGQKYKLPEISELNFSEEIEEIKTSNALYLKKISLMRLKYYYGHIGEKVFVEQMKLGGIDKVLFLPIASVKDDFLERMRWVTKLYRKEQGFWFAGNVPNSVPIGNVNNFVGAMKGEFGISALKCHPVVSGIDLERITGIERLEAILDACDSNSLPLVLHSGVNLSYWGAERGNYASLPKMLTINWNLSKSPVVLAHAGLHRCTPFDVEKVMLPILKKLMSRHENIYVDISGVSFYSMKKLLKEVDHNRILFGSDALYEAPWRNVVMLLYTLKESNMNLENAVMQIASLNPEKTIFTDDKNC